MTKKPDTSEAGPHPASEQNPRRDPPLDFRDADYGELSPGDYETLGFISGLEVHQQLLTRSKLFCRCPAGRSRSDYDAEVLRHMRPTLSELGEYDGTALMEFKTKKEIVYRLERDSVCTYEMDDTPPFEIDEEAVRGSVEVAQLLNLNLVSELHVMRKQYLDGSIPTGFQRTAMVGLTGEIPFRVPELGVDRELSIRQLSLEEDSCREVSDIGHRITFRTDRLGVPLIEAVTEPELVTPLELQAAGRLLAQVAQATNKARRGPGAARQDVNVSIAGGRRTEIKGVDNHRGLPRLVHNEAYRQLNLLRVKAELERRGVERSMFDLPDAGLPWEVSPSVVTAGRILSDCSFAPIQQARERGETICAVRLPGFEGLLNHHTQPGVTFAREFSDRVRVIACLEHRPFMIHTDISDYGLAPRQWRKLGTHLGSESGDAMVVVWGPEVDASTAVREILIRAQDAVAGVPAETRQAYRDGTNGFERILPGPDRMYPDTDTPPIAVTDSLVAEVSSARQETPWDREDRYRGMGLDPVRAAQLARSPWAGLFDALEPAPGEVARRLAIALQKRVPHHRRQRGAPERAADWIPDADRLEPLVRALESGDVRLEATEQILDALVERGEQSPEEVLARHRMGPDDSREMEERLAAVGEVAAEMEGRSLETLERWGMGELMRHFLGKLDPTVVRESLITVLAEVSGGTR